MALISAWDRQGSRSRPLFDALKRIFSQVLSSNVFLSLHYIPSSSNPADFPSRRLSRMDATLSPAVWTKVQRMFGGTNGHSVDLMALPLNVQCHLSVQPLPFFSPYPTPGCAGVNVFAQHPASHSPRTILSLSSKGRTWDFKYLLSQRFFPTILFTLGFMGF